MTDDSFWIHLYNAVKSNFILKPIRDLKFRTYKQYEGSNITAYLVMVFIAKEKAERSDSDILLQLSISSENKYREYLKKIANAINKNDSKFLTKVGLCEKYLIERKILK